MNKNIWILIMELDAQDIEKLYEPLVSLANIY